MVCGRWKEHSTSESPGAKQRAEPWREGQVGQQMSPMKQSDLAVGDLQKQKENDTGASVTLQGIERRTHGRSQLQGTGTGHWTRRRR
ncbi:hypothetical protein GW17_00013700 [Ensete ventricosum]|nr:hypothetical protein GW17_00013700 [Ensete ventricosum]